MEHVFTQDWFTHNTTNFNDCKIRLVKSFNEVNSILEIGCYEGRGTCWMLENMLSDTGEITCIDPFLSVEADTSLRDQVLEGRFNHNVNLSKKSTQTVNVIPTVSYTALATLISSGVQFDFIYIDGNHTGEGAMTDACMSWGLLRQGGIMLFDDYFWDHVPDILDRPKAAIDAFMNTFTRRFKVTGVGYQIAIQKI
jgi:predicted O-methyltransferase YrrM